MKLGLPGERKPSAIKKSESGISRGMRALRWTLAGIVAGLGLGDVISGGKVHEKFMQGTTGVVRQVANAAVNLDNTDRNASSAGAISEETVRNMQKAGIPIPSKKP